MARKICPPIGYFLWSDRDKKKWIDEHNAKRLKKSEASKRRMAKICSPEYQFRTPPTRVLLPAPMGYEWLTTYPDPRSRATGYDAGQRGWRVHLVPCGSNEKLPLDRRRSVCNLRPSHGWGMDLFIEDICFRCEKKYMEVCLAILAAPAAAVEEEKPVKLMEHFVGGVTICPQCGKAANASHICVASFAYDPKLAPEHLDPETGGTK